MIKEMEQDKLNRKREYSIKSIQLAFVRLLREKPFEQISVTEICKNANVNRSTFYNNYLDIYDLADQMIEKHVASLKQIVGNYEQLDEIEFYTNQLNAIKNCDYPDLLWLIPVTKTKDMLDDMMYQFVVKSREQDVPDQAFLKIAYSFCQAGSSELLRQWVMDDNGISPEKMAEYMCKLNTICIGAACPENKFSKKKKK